MKIRILSAIALIACISCTKNPADEPPLTPDKGTPADFGFSESSADNTGALMVQRDFTSAELAAKKAVFAIPKGTAGATCDFYAVANTPVTNITTKTGLSALLESSAADYNGTFAEVTSKAKRTGGFVMSGSVSKALAASGTQTEVAITLKRTVAKVALQVSLAPDFASKYRGAVRINSVKLSKAARRTEYRSDELYVYPIVQCRIEHLSKPVLYL